MANRKPDYHASREFRRILNQAHALWDEYYRKPQNHLARGFLKTKQAAYAAELAYDPQERLLSLIVRITTNSLLSPPQLTSFIRFQNSCSGLSHATLDMENLTVHVRTKTVLDKLPSQCTLKTFFNEAVLMLEKHDLHMLLN